MAADERLGTERTASHAGPTVHTIAGSVSWVAVGHGFQQVFLYATILVLAAVLPPSAFGTVAAAIAVLTVAGLLVESGVRGSIIAAKELTAEKIYGALLVSVAVALLLGSVVVMFADHLGALFAEGGDAAVFRVMAAGLLVAALGVVPIGVLQRAMRFRAYSTIGMGTTLIAAVTAMSAALAGAGVWALVARHLVAGVLLTVLAWIAARNLLPRTERKAGSRAFRWPKRIRRPENAVGFSVVAASYVLAMTFDDLLVGSATNATQLGFYALAFSLAFAPLTQFSWQLGGVLFPAVAATRDRETVARRTVKTARLVGLVLLPLVPPAIVLAPVVLPAVFGREWTPMVAPFQILLTVGAGHAVTNVIGESLSGTGNIRFRAAIDAVWAVATLVAVFGLVHLDGIRGAALAHLALFLPLAFAYGTVGMRRIGGDSERLWFALRGVLVPVAVQALVTLGTFAVLMNAGVARGGAAPVAAVVGLLFVLAAITLAPSKPLVDVRATIASARRREHLA